MKKILSIVLALCLVLSLAGAAFADGLAVGTYDPASAGDCDLVFAWWGNQRRDAVTEVAANYFTENYPNVNLSLRTVGWNDYWSNRMTEASSHTLPDVMQHDYAYIEQYVGNDLLLDLTPYIESGALDVSGIPENTLLTGKVGDGIYAICCAVNAPAMLYNKTLTDSLGIEVPMNITWDQFVEISAKIYAETGVGTVYGQGNSENDITYYARSLGYQAFWGPEGVVPTAEELTGYYARLIDGVAAGWLYDTDKLASVNMNDLAQHPMVYGSSPEVRAWCALAFSNQLSAFNKAAEADGIELGITSWPSSAPEKSNYMKPGQFFAVTVDAKNPDLAVAFLNYLINDVQGNILLEAERGVPPCTTVANAIADAVGAADKTYPVAVDYLGKVADGNCSPIFPPLPKFAGRAQVEVLLDLADTCLTINPGITAEEAAQQCVEGINDIAAE